MRRVSWRLVSTKCPCLLFLVLMNTAAISEDECVRLCEAAYGEANSLVHVQWSVIRAVECSSEAVSGNTWSVSLGVNVARTIQSRDGLYGCHHQHACHNASREGTVSTGHVHCCSASAVISLDAMLKLREHNSNKTCEDGARAVCTCTC